MAPPSTVMYKVDGALPPELAKEVEPGSNLLVSGPPMTGKRRLTMRLLARGARDGEGAVIVSTRNPVDKLANNYQELLGGTNQQCWFVDCVNSEENGPSNVRYVTSPSDLTGIGIEFSEIANAANETGVPRLRVGFDSLSPLLMYADLQRAFRFLHVFTSQIQSRNWLGLFVLDPESHDDQAVNTIRQLFDGLIELRVDDDGGRRARVRAGDDGPTQWVTLE